MTRILIIGSCGTVPTNSLWTSSSTIVFEIPAKSEEIILPPFPLRTLFSR